jgi:hypothetical protein
VFLHFYAINGFANIQKKIQNKAFSAKSFFEALLYRTKERDGMLVEKFLCFLNTLKKAIAPQKKI